MELIAETLSYEGLRAVFFLIGVTCFSIGFIAYLLRWIFKD